MSHSGSHLSPTKTCWRFGISLRKTTLQQLTASLTCWRRNTDSSPIIRRWDRHDLISL